MHPTSYASYGDVSPPRLDRNSNPRKIVKSHYMPLAGTAFLLVSCLCPTQAEAEASWSDAGTLAESFNGHTATLLTDGKVLVSGGGTPDESGFFNNPTDSAVVL